MIDWQEVSQHCEALGIDKIDDELVLALFPPKPVDGKRSGGCTYYSVAPGRGWDAKEMKEIETLLASKPGYSLGAIFNPGGTKNAQIKFCRFLMFEDDGEGGLEEKKGQWEAAGLPRPSFQIWTGGKSVHHYWLLEKPCTNEEFKRGQKRLARHCQRELPEAGIDSGLSNPSRILRMAGGTHPSTGEQARYLSASGEKFSYERLWNLTGEDNYTPTPSASTLSAVRDLYDDKPTPVAAPQAQEKPDEIKVFPEDRDSDEFKKHLQTQLLNDEFHRPSASSFKSFSRTRQLELVVTALPFCIERGEPGSGTYPAAFKILAAMVNEYGTNDALDCAYKANWSQQGRWDIVHEVNKIEENSTDRDDTGRVTIYHLFDSAEYNGWARPWKLRSSKGVSYQSPEDIAELRALKQQHVREYIEARAASFTLADALHPALAALLGARAKAFPVSEIAMLPPFLAASAAMLGTKYRVEVKPGYTEPMVIWCGAVGEASTLKTPVAQQMLRPLLKEDAMRQQLYKDALKAYRAADKSDKSEPPKPPRKFVAGDATLEGLCSALDNPSNDGMVSYHDELVAFIASLDAYRGKSGPSKDRAHWLSMWSGNEINILRKGHDPIFIPETAVSLFGCVQQDKLTELLHGDDATAKSGDGFWARFLWCVPCNPFPQMNRDGSDITKELGAIYGALAIPNGKITVKLSDEAWKLWAEQADAWSKEVDETYPARQAFLGKMRGYTVRFAGLIHALDYAERIQEPAGGSMRLIDKEIPGAVMARALTLSHFFINQFDVLAPQVGGNSDLPEWVVKIVDLAVSREDKKVTATDLRKRKWGKTLSERRKMLQSLVDEYGIGKMVEAKRLNQVWWVLT